MIASARRLALALALGGCTSLLPGAGDPPQLYQLTPKSSYAENLPKVDWQLLVDVPLANAGLDTPRIALSRGPTTIDYFANAAWTDRAPLMVQTLLVESFDNTGRITAIGRESLGLRADYVLKPELREFQAEYTGPDAPPTVRVRINAKLVKMPERAIIAQTSSERAVQAGRNEITAIVAAFDEALGGAIRPLVEWTLTTPPRNTRQRP